jgi:hypothetical protein
MYWLCDGKATKQGILNALDEIASQASATDQVVIFFAGHGWRDRDTTAKCWKYYLIPYDATFASAAERGIVIDDLRTVLGALPAQELVLILDCCHSGGMMNPYWTSHTLEEMLQGWRSHYVMAASRGYEKAGEDGAGGFFTKALCEALSGDGVTPDEMGRISAQKAWSHAADLVKVRAAHQQVAVSSGIGSPIYLTCVERDLVLEKSTSAVGLTGHAAVSKQGYGYCPSCACRCAVLSKSHHSCPICGMSIRIAGAEVDVFGQSAEEVLLVADRMAESLLNRSPIGALDSADKATGGGQIERPQKVIRKRWWEFWK